MTLTLSFYDTTMKNSCYNYLIVFYCQCNTLWKGERKAKNTLIQKYNKNFTLDIQFHKYCYKLPHKHIKMYCLLAEVPATRGFIVLWSAGTEIERVLIYLSKVDTEKSVCVTELSTVVLGAMQVMVQLTLSCYNKQKPCNLTHWVLIRVYILRVPEKAASWNIPTNMVLHNKAL